MRITHLSLTNFRNYARLELSFPPGTIIVYGDNAQGKTSLLEAVYYLATSRSPYTHSDRQLINWLAQDEPLPYARLVAELQTLTGLRRIEVTIVNEHSGQSGRFKKQIRINGVEKRVMDLLGQVRVVLFLPQDLALVEGPPVGRRHYLNVTLCQTSPDYCRALSQYEKVLTQRNALLRQFQEQQRGYRPDLSQIAFWDEKLAASGAALIAGRYRLVCELERRAQRIHGELSGAQEHLRLRYDPGFDATPVPEGQMSFDVRDMGASALPQLPLQEIAEAFRSRLKQTLREDIARGMTTIGPQRDELRFLVNGRDLGLYGSRGQNRTAVLAIKLAELEWMQAETGEPPILLLDEVAAELDPQRRSYLLDHIASVEQVMVTSAEPELLAHSFGPAAVRWQVRAGTIRTSVS